MSKEELKESLQQQIGLLLEASKERAKWQNGADDIMKLSIGMSYIAKAILACDNFEKE